MAKRDLLMPQMGESITEGTVIRWLKNEGDSVAEDEIILEISTDKVDSEIPSPYAGVVTKMLAAEGDTVLVDSVLAHITTDAEAEVDFQTPASAGPETQESAIQAAVIEPQMEPPEAIDSGSGVVDLLMPQMGESITEGTVIRWLKQEGDLIARDEVVLEISTDKVDSEIPSTHAGSLVKLLVGEGDTVAVGSVIAQISTEAGTVAAETKNISASSLAVGAAPRKSEIVAASQVTPAPPVPMPIVQPTNGERRFYSPLVRSMARAEGLTAQELSAVSGSGAHGRVTKIDLVKYLDSRKKGMSVSTPSATPEVQTALSDDRIEVIPMNTMRKSIAAHMIASVQTSPHVFAVSEADMSNIVRFRDENKSVFFEKAGTKLTYMPFLAMACARALQDFPLVNSSVEGSNIIRKKYINIGIAVALENSGLIVPVVKGADNLNIIGLAREINDLAARARSKKLKIDEVQDGTFSITNMGSFGSLMGLPIINQPQVAILGVGTIQKRPVVINDAIAIRSMMYISLSFDHRIVDGALAGQFLEKVAANLTNFETNTIF